MNNDLCYTIKKCKDKAKWDRFVSSSPQGNIFSKTSFLDALLIEYDCWLVKANNDILAGAIVLKKDNEPVHQQYTFSMYQGLYFSKLWQDMPIHKRPIWTSKILSPLIDKLAQNYDTLSFCLHHSMNDLREIQWYHYHEPELGQFIFELRYTGIINLKKYSNFENYLASIRKTRRNEYRQASRHLIIKESKDINILNRLHEATFKRQGIKRNPENTKLLKSITSAALKEKFGKLLVCYDSKRHPISASLFLYDGRSAYYLFGANDPNYRKTNSGIFLFLENVKKSFDKRVESIDVCGINSPNRGDFKTSLNAEPIPYFIVTWKNPKDAA